MRVVLLVEQLMRGLLRTLYIALNYNAWHIPGGGISWGRLISLK